MYNEKHEAMKREAIKAIIWALECDYDGYYCDLHNKVFNENWYTCMTDKAKAALNEYDVFKAIELVRDYEEDNFGRVTTDLANPVELLSMVWYIIGDEVICDMNAIEVFDSNWDNRADEETNKIILDAMKEMFKE
jgi:hypothetical protein